MDREKTLVKNTIIISIGNILTKMISFFLLPLYTKILTTEQFGVVDLISSLGSLVLPILTLQIEEAVFRYLLECDTEQKKKNIISIGVKVFLFNIIIYAIVCAVLLPFINNQYKYLLVINIVTCAWVSFLQYVSRGFRDNVTYSISSVISGTVTILFSVLLLVVFKFNAYGVVSAIIIGQIICSIYLSYKTKIFKYISFKKVDSKTKKEMIKYSIPLIPNSISWWIVASSDRLIISSFLGIAYNGILAAANKFTGIYVTIYNIYYLSWKETMAYNVKDSDFKSFFNRMYNTSLEVFISMAILLLSVMPFVYPIIIDKAYIDGYFQIPILILGSIFTIISGLLGVIYVCLKKTKAISITTIMSAIINIALDIFLIRYIGLYAASVSTLVSYIVMTIYRMIDINKNYFVVEICKKFILKTVVALAILIPIYYSSSSILYIIGIVIALMYAFDVNKKNVVFIKNIFLKKFLKKRVGNNE